MPRRARGGRSWVLLAAVAASTGGCTFLTSWAGYDDGGAGDDGGFAEDSVRVDAPSPYDAASDGGPAADALVADSNERDAPRGDDASDAAEDAAPDTGSSGDDSSTDAGPISFVQVTAATPSGSVSSASATFPQPQSSGDLIVLVIGWGGNATITQVGDSQGNGYAAAAGPTHISAGITQSIYYAKGISAASAGANTVTVTLGTSTTPLDVRAAEYAGLDAVTPFDTSAAWGGRGTSADSLPATTTAARELIFGAGITIGSFTGPGAAFTLRKLTGAGLGVVEDRIVASAGSYTADAPLASSASYVMQVATFR